MFIKANLAPPQNLIQWQVLSSQEPYPMAGALLPRRLSNGWCSPPQNLIQWQVLSSPEPYPMAGALLPRTLSNGRCSPPQNLIQWQVLSLFNGRCSPPQNLIQWQVLSAMSPDSLVETVGSLFRSIRRSVLHEAEMLSISPSLGVSQTWVLS